MFRKNLSMIVMPTKPLLLALFGYLMISRVSSSEQTQTESQFLSFSFLIIDECTPNLSTDSFFLSYDIFEMPEFPQVLQCVYDLHNPNSVDKLDNFKNCQNSHKQKVNKSRASYKICSTMFPEFHDYLQISVKYIAQKINESFDWEKAKEEMKKNEETNASILARIEIAEKQLQDIRSKKESLLAQLNVKVPFTTNLSYPKSKASRGKAITIFHKKMSTLTIIWTFLILIVFYLTKDPSVFVSVFLVALLPFLIQQISDILDLPFVEFCELYLDYSVPQFLSLYAFLFLRVYVVNWVAKRTERMRMKTLISKLFQLVDEKLFVLE